MADYIVTGKKGDGKSLVCVGKIRDALMAGKRVATNLNLNLEFMLPHGMRNVSCTRLPDYPTLEDMEAIGLGCDSVDEDRYGYVVLDEMAVWMNAREWNDKRRAKLLSWFVHSRKKRWHCMFITQGLPQLDKQFRESLADHHVPCRRLDKIRIPFIGPLTKHLFGFELRPPKVHVAKVIYGIGEREAILSDRWTYRARDLYPTYDTEQEFSEDYEHAIFSYLSPWHIKGRIDGYKLRPSERLKALLFPPPRPSLPSKPQLPLVALISRLPPEQRIPHLRRLQLSGAF